MNSEPPSDSTLRFWRRAFFVSLGMVVIPPMIGMAGTVIHMITTYRELSATGANDPAELAESVSNNLTTTMIGLVVSVIGLVLFIICLIRYLTLRKYRSQTS